jgi:hypothetical protein
MSMECFIGTFQVHRNALILLRGAGSQGEKKPQACCGFLGKQGRLEHGLDSFSFVGKFLERLVDLLA